MTIILQKSVQLQNRTWVSIQAPQWFREDRVAQRYQDLFSLLDWSDEVDEGEEQAKPVGRLPHPDSAYIKAHMVMIEEKKAYVSELRDYLLEHPTLIWLLDFRLVPDEDSPYGFDVEKSLPCERHLRRKLHQFEMSNLNELLVQTVKMACELEPELGQTVSIDVKHIYAPVKENNPKAYVSNRYDPEKQPSADPDCRLGLKRRRNQEDEQGAKTGKNEWLWGYGTGVAVSQTQRKESIVLADYTQPFNENDVTYGLPLLQQAEDNLGFKPKHITADAAFDAYYMYEGRPMQGIAAIPLNLRGNACTNFNQAEQPLCACNQKPMRGLKPFIEKQRQVRRFKCDDCGKTRKLAIEKGSIIRLQLDRSSQVYKAIYKERTATERINSQAKALGIERPKQRRQTAIERRNRLIYVVINLHTIQRLHKRKLKIRSPDNFS
jgi:hypothetical protein